MTHPLSEVLGLSQSQLWEVTWTKCSVGLPSLILNLFILQIFVEGLLSIRQCSSVAKTKTPSGWERQTENR